MISSGSITTSLGRIRFGPARLEGLTVLREGQRIDRIQDQEVVLEKGIGDGSPGLFQGNGHAASFKALPQLLGPLVQGFGALLQSRRLAISPAGGFEAGHVKLIGPIQTNPGRNFRARDFRLGLTVILLLKREEYARQGPA
jgi:hypothetical protein